MNEQNRIAVMSLLDAIYEGISSTEDQSDRNAKAAVYIGWLEGALLAYCPDDRVSGLMNTINVVRPTPPQPTDISEDGSFY
jgi:hypothetical protein